jgi:hypothetical protein
MTEEKDVIFEQYKMYTEQKEKFIERNFQTNKFYLLIVLGLFLAMLLTQTYTLPFGFSSLMVFSGAGLAVSVLWWFNMDAYNQLIKIKLDKVICELEKQLPAHPYVDEFNEIVNLRKKKKVFIFTGMQKTLATFVFLVFFIIFVNEMVPLATKF